MRCRDADCSAVVEEISAVLRSQVFERLGRRGVVMGISGGVDSSVCAALAVRALGADRVFGILMPESESDPDSLALGLEVADWLGISRTVEDITPILTAAKCYDRRDDAIRQLVPEFDAGWRCKIIHASGQPDQPTLPYLIVESPAGERTRTRMSPTAYRAAVAATNFKQRIRKMLEYHHADRLHYAVLGTPNRLEFDQGFFVKGGDGLADVKPIAHLYKGEVYRVAAFLGVPAKVTARTPTTDTYSLPQSQEEFYFGAPAAEMDSLLATFSAGHDAVTASAKTGIPLERTERIFRDIQSKRHATRYLHAPALLVECVSLDDPTPRPVD